MEQCPLPTDFLYFQPKRMRLHYPASVTLSRSVIQQTPQNPPHTLCQLLGQGLCSETSERSHRPCDRASSTESLCHSILIHAFFWVVWFVCLFVYTSDNGVSVRGARSQLWIQWSISAVRKVQL